MTITRPGTAFRWASDCSLSLFCSRQNPGETTRFTQSRGLVLSTTSNHAMSRPLFTVDSAQLLLVPNVVGRVVGGRDKTHCLEYHQNICKEVKEMVVREVQGG